MNLTAVLGGATIGSGTATEAGASAVVGALVRLIVGMLKKSASGGGR